MRYLPQARVAGLERFLLREHLVELRHLAQHARIRPGNAGDGHHPDQPANQEDVKEMQWNRNLAELSVSVAGDEKDVEALMQYVPYLAQSADNCFEAGSRTSVPDCEITRCF